MAYQTQRDPFLDSATREMILRRLTEIGGIALLLAALALALILGSYVPDDPGWMAATDEPTANLLGRFGASLAAPMAIILGMASWGIVVLLAVWGVRLILHDGLGRATQRLVIAPVALVLVAVFAATIAPGPSWGHAFGLGGLLGDTVLGALANIMPMQPSYTVQIIALPMFLLSVGVGLYVLGATRDELKRLGWLALFGIVTLYNAALRGLGSGAQAAARGARNAAQRATEPRVEATAPDEALIEDDTFDAPAPLVAAPAAEPRARTGLMAPLSGLVRRASSEPAQPRHEPPLSEEDVVEAPQEDRIKARISDAIRLRANRSQAEAAQKRTGEMMRAEPPVTRAQAAEPMMVKTPGAIPPAPMAMVDDTGSIAEPDWATPSRAIPPAPEARTQAETPFDDDAAVPEDTAAPFEAAPRESLPSQDESQAAPFAPIERRAVVQHPTRKATQPSRRAKAEAQPKLAFDAQEADFELPPLSLLTNPTTIERHHLSDEALEENARMLETVLDDYGVKGEIVSVRPGPVVTMYELEPAPGLKASRVIGLADDIARSMSALSARVSTIPGRKVIGIELPNVHREKVVLREILADRAFGDGNQRLPLALGKDIGGEPMVANLAKMPHLLIAGTTGSGKSVAINTMILSLLYKLTPEECRLIMIDPKMLELSVYDGIPHLLSPVVTDPKKAVVALKWVVGEMEERYRKMSKMGVRNIDGYNGRVRDAMAKGEMFSRTVQTGFDEETGDPIFETEEFAPEALPFIVVIVDEMADLMMVAGKEIEACIQRLAQMARASGIHLIMATQRPSVDVITGTIKANFPTRISFQVTSKVDSRTILGEMGAEQLLGMGDMLYMAGGGKITRCHGPFVSDEEVEEIVSHLKAFGPPDYVGGVQDGPSEDKEDAIDAVLGLNTGGNTNGADALYDQAVAIVAKDRKCSTSYIQRKLGIGYNKAARLVEQMEEEGIVSTANHVGKREILIPEA